MNPVYFFCRSVVWLIFKIRFRHKVVRPKEIHRGGAIIASNHISHLDPPALGISWPQAVHFMARATLFTNPRFRWLITRLNAHPIDLEKQDLKALRHALDLLKRGNKLVIFPEGTRSRTGELGEPQGGVAMLALRANVPVIPAYIFGTDALLPPGASKIHWKGRTRVVFGDPIYPQEFAHMSRKAAQEALSEGVMTAIAHLSKR